MNTMKVCDNGIHQRQVPLIWTFAFMGCEYWCPVCGMAGGMFGTGKLVPITPDLDECLHDLETRSAEYLRARGKLIADRVEVDGVMVHRTEVPNHVYEAARKVVDSWERIDEGTLIVPDKSDD